MNTIEFKENLMRLSPKKLQGLFVEYLKQVENLTVSDNIHYSLNSGSKKITVRCSRPFKEIKSKNFLEQLQTANSLVSIKENSKFLCNLQQIKQFHSDEYYCSLLFDEAVYIFKLSNHNLNTDKTIGYLNYQHYGNPAEGQLHISHKNVKSLIENYLYKRVTYSQLLNFAKKL